MKTNKLTGVWMDYSKAEIMEVQGDLITSKVIESDFTFEEKQHSFFRNEGLMHKKEQRLEGEYFKSIMKELATCKQVVLFGPGDAKNELFNRITSDPHFKSIRVSVEPTDKLTEKQRQSFVRNFFHVTSAAL